MRLKSQQLRFFQTFGFAVFRRLLSAAEVSEITSEFDRAMRTLRDQRLVGYRNKVPNLSRFFMDSDTPHLASLAADSRFAAVARQLLQRPVLGIHVAGAYYMGDTAWHSDNSQLSYHGVKFVAYLDRLNGTNGALRLIPGSHRDPMWRRSGLSHDTVERFGVGIDAIPAYVFDSQPGDVLAFNHRVWHASAHGPRFRRMFDVNFYADPNTAGDRRAFVQQMRRNHLPSALLGMQMYPQYWRSRTSTHHRRWINRLRELGVLETQLP